MNQLKIGASKLWHPEFSNIGNCVIGDGCIIHSHVWIGDNVKIGNRVRIQAFSFIPDGVEIGDNVFIGPRCTFTNDKYPPSDEWLKTLVKDGASLGAGTIVLPGITIGRSAKIGAGSLVTKNIPDFALAYGNPARVVRIQACTDCGQHPLGCAC